MKNCALVEELRLVVDKNLNILTGETGSGKSIIIDALGLCLGEKYDRSFLRKGTNKGIVEALFEVNSERLKSKLLESGIEIDEENQIVISREIYEDGKSISRINGRNAKVSLLRELASYLIDIHGQHQNQALFNKDIHIDFLDLFGESHLINPKQDYEETYIQYNEVKKALNILTENKDDMQIQREIDLIKFQLNEIDTANLNRDEYEDKVLVMDSNYDVKACLKFYKYEVKTYGEVKDFYTNAELNDDDKVVVEYFDIVERF
jgi:DNA repair protein RecN (Recombination protein N)